MPITSLKIHAILVNDVSYYDDQDFDELFDKIDTQLDGAQVAGCAAKPFWPQYSSTDLLDPLLKELKLGLYSILVAKEEPIEIKNMLKVFDVLADLTDTFCNMSNIDIAIIDSKYVLIVDVEH